MLRELLAKERPLGIKTTVLLALFIFGISFTIKSLHAADMAPAMNTPDQPGLGMTRDYDFRAVAMVEGHGLLVPDNVDSSDTSLLGYPPGYSMFLSSIYRLRGKDYFLVQVIQNVLNSLSPVLIFMIAAELLGWRIGLVSGLLAGASHHLSYYSNFILPDALCALPVLAALYLVIRADRAQRGSYWLYSLAGGLLGISNWLRPNAMFLAPFLAAVILALSERRKETAKRVAVMVLLSFLTIMPITIRNYMIYGQFVPISNHLGIVLWEGIGESSGDRFGAVALDTEVAAQDAVVYGDQRYAGSWSTPDGIKRDQDKIKKSLGIIIRHPFWYASVMLGRMSEMMKYSAYAPLVFRTQRDLTTAVAGDPQRRETDSWESPPQAAASTLLIGKRLSSLRPLARGIQRLAKETVFAFILAGVVIVGLLDRRKALLLLAVPIYYLLFQSAMHIEFRYALAMHYFLFVFAAATWVLLIAAAARGIRNLRSEARQRPKELERRDHKQRR